MATNGNWEEMNPGCEQVAVGFTFEDRFHHTCISGSPTVNFCKHYSYFLLKVFFFPSNRKKSTLITTSEISFSVPSVFLQILGTPFLCSPTWNLTLYIEQ